MKNKVTKIKISLDGLNRRKEMTEERSSESENKTIEFASLNNREKTNWKKKKKSLWTENCNFGTTQAFWYLRSCLTEMAPHSKIFTPNNSCSRAVAVNLFESNFLVL